MNCHHPRILVEPQGTRPDGVSIGRCMKRGCNYERIMSNASDGHTWSEWVQTPGVGTDDRLERALALVAENGRV